MNEEKKQNRIVKILCVGAGLIAVALLCFFSSRFSWFGVYGGSVDSSDSPDSTPATTPPVSSVTTPQSTPQVTTPQTTADATTTATTTTPATTTTAATTVTTTTTAATTTAKPEPEWTETVCTGTLYVIVNSCSTRKQGLQGSQVMGYKFYGEAVNVVATTNTGYYKLDNGTFIHSDYLSVTKPPETTTTAATTPPPAPVNSDPEPNSVFDNITVQPVNCSEEEAEVFRLVNEIRKQNGVAALKWDMNAYIAARTRCEEVMVYFSHNRNGDSFDSVYSSSIRNRLSYVGENLGSGQPSAQDVVDDWMNSELHRKNILNPDFENLAVAFGTSNDIYCYYWVQEFTTYKKS